MTIAILGAGRLGEALARGLTGACRLQANEVLVTCRRAERAEELRGAGYRVATSPEEIAEADLAFLCVRHRDAPALLGSLRGALAGRLVVSFVVGLPGDILARGAPGARVVRATTNAAVAVGAGFTALAPGPGATPADLERASALLSAVGEVAEVRESQLDQVNALAGAGPAFALAFAEALAEAGTASGLDAGLAHCAASAALRAAVALVDRTGRSFDSLVGDIAGPGGSTRAGLDVLSLGGLADLTAKAVTAALERAQARNAEAQATQNAALQPAISELDAN